MKTTLSKEIPLVLIILVPFIYLAMIWNELPEQIAMQYDLNGNVSRYGSKSELIMLNFLLPVLTYLIFLVIPKLNPKKKIEQMGNKFYYLRFILVLFMSALAAYAVHTSRAGNDIQPGMVFMIIGLMFAVLGNYLQSVKPNYFIGIRTPWTLENEEVWKKTHKLGGKMWFVSGLLLTALGFLLPLNIYVCVFMAGLVIMTLIPTIYSYRLSKKGDTTVSNN